MATILKAEKLVKMYDDFLAIDKVSFDVNEGEIIGLVGPNGAGKTTIIQMLLLLLEPTSGKIEIFGLDSKDNREKILECINFVAPYTNMPYNLTVEENLTVFSLLYGIKDYKKKIEELLHDFHLKKFRHTRAGAISSGEQTRLSLAKAFLNDPKLLLLDEPTAFLDPSASRMIRDSIHKRIETVKGAAFWTSHNMREIESACDRIFFLKEGKVIVEGTPDQLRKKFGKNNLEEIFLSLVK